MLNYLHEKINQILPISGIQFDPESKQYIITYIEQPTEEQATQIFYVLAGWPLESAKLKKLQEIDIWWKNVINQGWETPYGWKLGLNTEDITLLTGIFTLSKEAAELGITEDIFIIDTEGNSHALNLQDLTSLMLQYGQARTLLSKTYAQRVYETKEALTIEELGWI
jgi:hypothetical protein